jgi:hypothetical protein
VLGFSGQKEKIMRSLSDEPVGPELITIGAAITLSRQELQDLARKYPVAGESVQTDGEPLQIELLADRSVQLYHKGEPLGTLELMTGDCGALYFTDATSAETKDLCPVWPPEKESEAR